MSQPAAQVPRVITVTVSDTRTAADDTSGKALMDELQSASIALGRHVIVPDEPDRITEIVGEVVTRNEADAIVFTGGTGIAPRDLTYETL